MEGPNSCFGKPGCHQAQRGSARDNIIAIEAPHGDSIGRVRREQNGLGAQ